MAPSLIDLLAPITPLLAVIEKSIDAGIAFRETMDPELRRRLDAVHVENTERLARMLWALLDQIEEQNQTNRSNGR